MKAEEGTVLKAVVTGIGEWYLNREERWMETGKQGRRENNCRNNHRQRYRLETIFKKYT